MASCEKCWSDAYRLEMCDMSKSHSEHYHDLLEKRKCTPEQQAGEDAMVCAECGRKTVHQWAKICMACGKKNEKCERALI